ncbi:OST-HTH/LOTUS domain-containing protein [Gemmiger formicilis]|nr:OST-HTH/LOTUS domain-containing protein [Gemmiger formicilis]
MDDGTGWVRTSRVGDQLIKRYPDFDVRNFGSKSLNKFLASLPELEVEERILANGNPIQFVRVKPVPKPVKSLRREERQSAQRAKRSKGEIRLPPDCRKRCVHPLAPSARGSARRRWGENCTAARCKQTTAKQQPRTHRVSGAFSF